MSARMLVFLALVALASASPAAGRSPAAARIGEQGLRDMRSIDRHLQGWRVPTVGLAQACKAAAALPAALQGPAKAGLAKVEEPLRKRLAEYEDRLVIADKRVDRLKRVKGLSATDQVLVQRLHAALAHAVRALNDARVSLLYSLHASTILHCTGSYSADWHLDKHDAHVGAADVFRADAEGLVATL